MIRHIVFLFISLFVISCTNEKKNNNDTSREISLVDTKSCSLENVISKMEIIELPRIEDAYIAGYKSFLAKNNLYIFEDKKVLCLSLGRMEDLFQILQIKLEMEKKNTLFNWHIQYPYLLLVDYQYYTL